MTSTSTELDEVSSVCAEGCEGGEGWRGSHFFLGGSHGAL